MVIDIDRHGRSYYARRGKETVEITTVHPHKYLRTKPDGRAKNNLSNLPDLPEERNLVGYFKVTSGQLVVSDPGYLLDTKENRELGIGPTGTVAAKNGTWRATVEPAPEGRMRLPMRPGLACGSGWHAATQLAVEGLERTVKPGMRVLDVGTGSGILAQAATAVQEAGPGAAGSLATATVASSGARGRPSPPLRPEYLSKKKRPFCIQPWQGLHLNGRYPTFAAQKRSSGKPPRWSRSVPQCEPRI